MTDSFLQQVYRSQPKLSHQNYLRPSPTKQPFESSIPIHNNHNEFSLSESTEQKCNSLYTACALGLLAGALLCSIALIIALSLWLTPKSTNSTTSTVSVTTSAYTTYSHTKRIFVLKTGGSTAAVASTIPVTAATTTICSVSTVATTTAAPNTTTIYSMNYPCSATSYYSIVFYYIAQGPNETITIGARNDPATTYFDDFSVVSNGVQLLCNGGFENGTQICWQGAYHISGGCGNTGSYCYADGIVGSLDYGYQTFSTTPGALLNISFWTHWTGSGTGVISIVTISP